MNTSLRRIAVTRKTGEERFTDGAADLGVDLRAFWQWSVSDVVSNATRGRLAEFIVARALGVDTAGVRDEWAAFDLSTPTGVRVEVKSSAFLQSWHQNRASTIIFATPATRAFSPETGIQERVAKRQADVYVFALLAHADKATLNPLDVGQWRFYVLSTAVLNARTRSQRSITLRSIEKLCGPGLRFAEVSAAVAQAGIRLTS